LRYFFLGGPLDGGEVEQHMKQQDYLLMQHGSYNSSVTYYYVKCEEHPYFEFAGEVEEEEQSE
jgi:hypothetical protein